MWHDQTESSPETVRREWLEHAVFQWLPEEGRSDADARRKALRSPYARALDAISRAAVAHAENTKADLESLLDAAFSLVWDIQYATADDESQGEPAKALGFWRHRIQPLDDVRGKKVPAFVRQELEACVGRYLALPYRCGEIDRTLVDALLALELYQFADEMINEVVIKEIGPPRSPLKQPHPLSVWFQELGIWAMILLVLAIFAFTLHHVHLLSDGWALGIFLLGLGLGVLGMAWTTIMAPYAWILRRKQVHWVYTLIEAMTSTYAELRSEGPVSVAHLRERMHRAEDKGVIWPAPLYALLDDVGARSGRL